MWNEAVVAFGLRKTTIYYRLGDKFRNWDSKLLYSEYETTECGHYTGTLSQNFVFIVSLVVRWLLAEDLFSIKSPHDKHCNLIQVRSKAFVKTPWSVRWWSPRLFSYMPSSVIQMGISQPFFVNGHKDVSDFDLGHQSLWSYASCVGSLIDWPNVPFHVWSSSNQYTFFGKL